jgi:hypothetical protein
MEDISRQAKKRELEIKQKRHAGRTFGKGYEPIDEDENIPLMDVDTKERLAMKERNREEAWGVIKEKFPNVRGGTPPFAYVLNEYGRVEVKMLSRKDAKWWDIDDKKLPKTIKDFIGVEREAILGGLSEVDEGLAKSIEATKKKANDDTVDATTRSEAQAELARFEIEKDKVENKIDGLEKTMSIKDRVKRIFKKYGFTIASVVASVGVIIGVIISNLKAGLTTVAKGVGNGLKAIGKKLGTILPGMVGAIASFIFKTAGEVVGFLGKNAWLLIVGVVLYMVDRVKKKK